MGRKDIAAKIRLEGDAKGANKAIKSTETAFARLGKSIKANALKITAAFATIVVGFKQVEEAAARIARERALVRGVEEAGLVYDEFVGKLKEVSDKQIATADLVVASNRALALGIRATDLPGLMETATKASVKLGLTATEAFDNIVTGVGRASPLILDNLGIVVNATKVYSDFAAGAGQTVKSLTSAQRAVALTAAVIKTGADDTKDFADQQTKLTRVLNQSKTALKNWTQGLIESSSQNEGLLNTVIALNQAIPEFVQGIRNINDALLENRVSNAVILGTVDAVKAVGGAVALALTPITALIGKIREWGEATREANKEIQFAETSQRRLNREWQESQAPLVELIGEFGQYEGLVSRASDGTQALIDKQGGLAGSSDRAKIAIGELGDALGTVTSSDLADRIDEIKTALDKARDATGGFGQEFLAQQAIASAELAKLRTDIARLTGDVSGTAAAMGELGDALGAVGGDDIIGEIEAIETALGNLETATGGIGEAFENAKETALATLGQLEKGVDALNDRWGESNAPMLDAIGMLDSYGTVAEAAARRTEEVAEAQAKIEAAATRSATAMTALGETLDIQVSSDLVAEIEAMRDALEETRAATGGIGEEFKNQEAITLGTIKVMQAQVDILTGSIDGASTAIGALGDTLGVVTVDDLVIQIARIKAGVEAARTATGGLGEQFETLAALSKVQVAGLEKQIDKLTDGIHDSTSALEGLGRALGIVTSAELEGEITKIAVALSAVRLEAENGSVTWAEYQNAVVLAGDTTAILEDRAASLRAGFGDLASGLGATTGAADRTSTSFNALGSSVSSVNSRLSDQVRQLNAERAALGQVAIAVDQLTQAEQRRLRLTGQTAPGGRQLGISSSNTGSVFGPLFQNAPSGGTFTVYS